MSKIEKSGSKDRSEECGACCAQGFSQSSILTPRSHERGFTLVEMIMVIVITGIIGGMVAVFLKRPIQQYLDVSRRAELTDIADTALRRISRDVRTAVPNSLRVAGCGATPCVEFLPTKDGGRYRVNAPINALTFGSGGSNIFDIIGSPITFAANDYIVVGSSQSDGNPPYDQSASGVLRLYTGTAGAPQTTVKFNATPLPPSADMSKNLTPSQNFDVVDGTQQAVTYACTGTLGTLDASQSGQAKLVRYSAYGINSSQSLPVAASPPVLASKVSACTIDYSLNNQGLSLLAVTLTLTSGGESVTLYNEIHVNNAP